MDQVRRAIGLNTDAAHTGFTTVHQPAAEGKLLQGMLRLAMFLAVLAVCALGAAPAFAQGNDPRLDVPGTQITAPGSVPSDQKAGSILVYPVYTSMASASNLQNTRINMTNIGTTQSVFVHLFFVDGSSCSISDSYLCLTPNQTSGFLVSDVDPGVTGYIIAVAVNSTGCPIGYNGLIGDEFVKFGTGHAASLGATAIAALSVTAQDSNCLDGNPTATLKFNDSMYQPLPRVLAADSLVDRKSGNDTMLVLDRIGGSLVTGGSTLSGIFGILFDDAETPLSFTLSPGTCQFRSSLSNNFPRTTPRYETFIPAGRTGWMKLWSVNDAALLGATINFNPNATSAPGAFNQGHNMHALALTTTATLTIPVFPPSC